MQHNSKDRNITLMYIISSNSYNMTIFDICIRSHHSTRVNFRNQDCWLSRSARRKYSWYTVLWLLV